MKRLIHIFEAILWVSVLCAFLVRPAYAYLDPGSGSFVLQVLLAGLVGSLFLMKQYWARVRAAVRKLRARILCLGSRGDEHHDE